jgi:hypothetical protein
MALVQVSALASPGTVVALMSRASQPSTGRADREASDTDACDIVAISPIIDREAVFVTNYESVIAQYRTLEAGSVLSHSNQALSLGYLLSRLFVLPAHHCEYSIQEKECHLYLPSE